MGKRREKMRHLICVFMILLMVFTGSLISAQSKQKKGIPEPRDLTKDLAPLEAATGETKAGRAKQCQQFWESLSKGEIGRFQAISPAGQPFIFVLDTKEGHIWIWKLQEEEIDYKGQICPASPD
jgi:hypothetical protein